MGLATSEVMAHFEGVSLPRMKVSLRKMIYISDGLSTFMLVCPRVIDTTIDVHRYKTLFVEDTDSCI